MLDLRQFTELHRRLKDTPLRSASISMEMRPIGGSGDLLDAEGGGLGARLRFSVL